MSGKALLDHFSALEDPRQSGKVVYPLPEIMLLVLCATLAAAEDFVEVRRWGEEKLDCLRTMLPFARGIPSHDSLNDVLNARDPGLFSACFTAWVAALGEAEPDIVAVDGKSSRRARAKGGHPLHVVSAWATRQRLVLGQEAVGEKANEIVAIPLLLERLHLTGALVTIDAMGTQTAIAQTILDKGADYLLALKDNGPRLAEDVRLFFDDPGKASLDTCETGTLDHGRSETRRHVVCHDVGWLTSDRRYPGEPRCPGLKAIAMVEATVGRGETTSVERRYFLSSLPLDAGLFARAVRAHWGIENRPTGSSTSSSTTTSCACAPLTGRKTGHDQAYGHEPHPHRIRQRQPQDTPKSRRLEPPLPQRHPHSDRLKPFKRLPWARPGVEIPG